MYSYQPKKNKGSKKNAVIGIILIVFLAGLFFLKHKNDEKNQLLSSQEKEEDNECPAPSINAQGVYAAINNNQFQIIDIRSTEEFELEHIESSINIPVAVDDTEFNSQLINNQKKIIVIGGLSDELTRKITEKLISENYRAEYLKGGINAFISAGYEMVSYGNVESSKDRSKVIFITAQELIDRSFNNENFIFLDVRKKEDYLKSHIENSINMPLEILEKNKRDILVGKIVVIDENPVRSFQAAVRLYDMNIIGVYCLEESLSELKRITKEN